MDFDSFPFECNQYMLSSDYAIQRISTGCESIDKLLGGGLSTGEVTEVYGTQGSGKTQLAYSIISAVSRSNQGNSAVLIDTDGSFVIERFDQLGANRNLVHVLRLVNADEILACLPVLLPTILKQIGNVQLVVIDSFSFIARNCTYDNAIRRLIIFIDRLAHIAVTHNISVLITNDVKAQHPDTMLITDNNEYPIPSASLGAKWATVCPTRVALASNRDDERYATLVNHPSQIGGRALFTISTSSGVTDCARHSNG